MEQLSPEVSATKLKLVEHIQVNQDSKIKDLVEHIVNMGHVDFSLNDFLLIASDEECMLLIAIIEHVKSQGRQWLNELYDEFIAIKCTSCNGFYVNQCSDGWECVECGYGVHLPYDKVLESAVSDGSRTQES